MALLKSSVVEVGGIVLNIEKRGQDWGNLLSEGAPFV